MIAVNEKLKSELLEVITKMDEQIRKNEDKRRARIESELKTNAALQDKDVKIKKRARKFHRFKQEIGEMWQQLESSYNIGGINRLEDDLKDKQKQVERLKADVEAMERISKEQNHALESMGSKNKENSDKMYRIN